MSNKIRPFAPVKPKYMEMVFFYACPNCKREIPVIAPMEPTMAACDLCLYKFPIVPVSPQGINFVKIMLAGGKAAIDQDYM